VEQTTKGFMWRDIGLGDWLFDLDLSADREKILPTALSIVQDPAAAQAKVSQAQSFVRARQLRMIEVLRKACG